MPQSGQNLVVSGCVFPQFEHVFVVGALGFFVPQFVQKFPLFTVPQVQVQSVAGAGFLAPQLVQKLPVFEAPQEQFHVLVLAGAGFFAPQLEQNAPPVTYAPQVQVHAFGFC